MVMRRRSPRAQALVETAIAIPLLMLVTFAAIGMGRLVQVRMGLSVATREAARATALADMPRMTHTARIETGNDARDAAIAEGRAHGAAIANDFHLSEARFEITADDFRPGSWVTVRGTCVVPMTDVPLIRDVLRPVIQGRGIELHASHTERVDPYRSLEPPP